jgi:hypothetical protein
MKCDEDPVNLVAQSQLRPQRCSKRRVAGAMCTVDGHQEVFGHRKSGKSQDGFVPLAIFMGKMAQPPFFFFIFLEFLVDVGSCCNLMDLRGNLEIQTER